tara:strand:+ start:1660 stop:1986 length:327 start_codon:yes stop_codon:yes gene_type:complete
MNTNRKRRISLRIPTAADFKPPTEELLEEAKKSKARSLEEESKKPKKRYRVFIELSGEDVVEAKDDGEARRLFWERHVKGQEWLAAIQKSEDSCRVWSPKLLEAEALT